MTTVDIVSFLRKYHQTNMNKVCINFPSQKGKHKNSALKIFKRFPLEKKSADMFERRKFYLEIALLSKQ